MNRPPRVLSMLFAILSLANVAAAQTPSNPPSRQWKNGLPTTDDYFPIAVWLQQPSNAAKYKAIGINLYVGLWDGPTEAQLKALEKAGMPVICEQDADALKFIDRKIIVGWMHGDEPDNAQAKEHGDGYGPPITPEKIVAEYAAMRKADPTRPVMLNLGQGVAWDGWFGRGERTNKPEDYPRYVKGADLVSFDIYPAVHDNKEIAGKLWYVAQGVERLVNWTDEKKPVWACIETTRISNEKGIKPTPHQVRAEVWMAIIHGARGLIYFAHEFKPQFVEAGLLADDKMAAAVKSINAEVKSLAGPINNLQPVGRMEIQSSNPDVPIVVAHRHYQHVTYVFAVAMRDGKTTVSFNNAGMHGKIPAEVIGENRSISSKDGNWTDSFGGYDVHLYRLTIK